MIFRSLRSFEFLPKWERAHTQKNWCFAWIRFTAVDWMLIKSLRKNELPDILLEFKTNASRSMYQTKQITRKIQTHIVTITHFSIHYYAIFTHFLHILSPYLNIKWCQNQISAATNTRLLFLDLSHILYNTVAISIIFYVTHGCWLVVEKINWITATTTLK